MTNAEKQGRCSEIGKDGRFLDTTLAMLLLQEEAFQTPAENGYTWKDVLGSDSHAKVFSPTSATTRMRCITSMASLAASQRVMIRDMLLEATFTQAQIAAEANCSRGAGAAISANHRFFGSPTVTRKQGWTTPNHNCPNA